MNGISSKVLLDEIKQEIAKDKEEKNKNNLIDLMIVISGAAFAYSVAFYEAFVITVMWKWFIMPLSSSIPVLHIFHACGLVIFMNIFINKPKVKKDEEEKNPYYLYLIGRATLISVTVTWGIAWVIHCFM